MYPSGRTIAKGYDGAGRETYVQGQANGQTTNYAFVGGYWPHGALQYAAYANGYGVYPTYFYNSRLQMNAAYAIVQGDPNRFVTNWSLDWGGSGNNGTLRSRVESFGNGVPASQLPGVAQTFSYDNLNRLTAFTDYGSSRNYSYDTWGNGWVSNTSGLPLQGNTPTSNFYNGANQLGGGRTYDAAGNQTNVNGDTLTYDAENRLIAATEPAALGGATEPYIYDALGQRTIRQYPGNWVSYAYDAFGRKAATYNYWTSLNQEFIYMNGQLLATENFNNNGSPCTTCYYVWDHLGSPRLVTDSSGNVVSRHDYLPFGEEIPGGWAGRSSQWGVNDGSRDKFTGQERDAETGLDYFNARYFSGALGRFTSPDPMNAGADLTDPQTWNGYSYVRNNPMGLVDPSGMDGYSSGGGSCADDPICSYEYESFFPPWTDLPSAPPFIEVRKEPLPPGSFPGGESLGLPPGVSIPLPGVGILFGQANGCEFGVCGYGPAGPVVWNEQIDAQLREEFIAFAAALGRGVGIWAFGPGPNSTRAIGPYRVGAHQLTYGSWCGPGGSGPHITSRDPFCHIHDDCYDGHGLSILDNLNPNLSSSKAQELHSCNQALCSATTGSLINSYFRYVPRNAGACQ